MPAGKQPKIETDTASTYKQESNKEKQQYKYIVIMHEDDNNEKSVCNEKPFTSI